ncbi:Protein ImuB [Magnetospirillum sp. UT-4]|nr:Protein ImuB [Magnetospirillum sp. UT-4]
MVTTVTNAGLRRLAAVDRAAAQAGLGPGMSLADALALVPEVKAVAAEPEADQALLAALAERCGHYTPFTALDGADGVWLDIAGCDHLFGGEAALLEHLLARMARLGLAARAGLADTPGAAWAVSRFGNGRTIVPPGAQRGMLAPLPLAALRLPAAVLATLDGLGLRRIGDLYAIPAATLTARFGPQVARRLGQALGSEGEPISPIRPPLPHRLHAAFAEPMGRREDVAEATRRLVARLCRRLGAEHLGLRRLEVAAFGVDGGVQRVEAGTGRPVRDPRALMRLLAEKLDRLNTGFGIEMLSVAAPEVAPLAPEQGGMEAAQEDTTLAPLLDSLGNRLGFDKVARLAPHRSHLPERAVRPQPAAAAPPPESWPEARRPLRLFSHPEPVEAVAPVPDSPPVLFRWRRRTHRVARADGAERIACEWWRRAAPERDYYLVEDQQGRRFWLFRQGLFGADPPPKWFIHGVFG